MSNPSQSMHAIIRHNWHRGRPICASKSRESCPTLASYPSEEWAMSTAAREINGERERTVRGERAVTGEQTAIRAWQAGRKDTWWSQRREATLNWLALGVLLAAWNASDNGSSTIPAPRRPQALRGYSSVSVRAATLHSAELHNSAQRS
jgi:hypothetical protein